MRPTHNPRTLLAATGLLLALLLAINWLWPGMGVHGMRGASALAAVADIYPDPGEAQTDLKSALAQAKRERKRVIVDFGGNWCIDCHVLDIYFHDAQNLPLLQDGFVLVRVNIGEYDQNLDLAANYGIPLKKGVPALAVLTADGRLLYSQRVGEFEAMSRMDSASVTSFLTRWKPQR